MASLNVFFSEMTEKCLEDDNEKVNLKSIDCKFADCDWLIFYNLEHPMELKMQ